MTLDATRRPTDAERIDHAVSALLDGTAAAVPPALARELVTAQAVRAGLPPIPAGARFEAQLSRRLGAVPDRRLAGFVRQHQRLVLTGAVGSVVVSTASVAVVAWRVVHRTP
jgi:hypothetical protein